MSSLKFQTQKSWRILLSGVGYRPKQALSGSTVLGCLLALGLHVCAPVGQAEIIYDNTQSAKDGYYPTGLEFGDDVILGGSARTITAFQVAYFGEYYPTGTERAQVRFYANDVTGDDGPGHYDSPPGTKLYESPLLPISPGYSVLTLRGLSVKVPDHFTWSIQFKGMSNTYSNRAGLLFFDAPTVGSSFNDFWQKTPNGWGTFVFPNAIVANYGARIVAGPDSPAMVLSVTSTNNNRKVISITGPAYQSADLEYSATTNETHWLPLQTVTFLGQPTNLVQFISGPVTTNNFRLRLLPDTMIHMAAAAAKTNGSFQFRISGKPGRVVAVETSTDLTNWAVLGGQYLTSVFGDYTDAAAPNFRHRFYRTTYALDYDVVMASAIPLTNGLPLVKLQGPMGRDYVLQTSSDLHQWSSLSTNTFNFSDGFDYTPDLTLTLPARRYYRAVLLSP